MDDTIDALLDRMRGDLERLAAVGDARRFFHGTYLRTTEAVAAEIDRSGFLAPDWLLLGSGVRAVLRRRP